MLPSAKKSLVRAAWSPKEASWILIGCFLGGVFGIQVLSKVMHLFMPSHVVDCEHTHAGDDDHAQTTEQSSRPDNVGTDQSAHRPSLTIQRASTAERAAPINMENNFRLTRSATGPGVLGAMKTVGASEASDSSNPRSYSSFEHRPSLPRRLSNTLNQLASSKSNECNCSGPCRGFSDPCGTECFKNITARGGFRAPNRMVTGLSRRTKSAVGAMGESGSESTPLLNKISEDDGRFSSDALDQPPQRFYTAATQLERPNSSESSSTADEEQSTPRHAHLHKTSTTSSHANPDHHHHHVPSNAFLSIGLQTSIAIALHKLPEGFITYATNHANPHLGFAIFLALFIHNLTEGFAMALPLYLAVHSRLKAMAISFVLGGLSQPLGAAVAAVWFRLAGDGEYAPNESVYGVMFAVTAGIMASVALSLFGEALDLTHFRRLCQVGAFCGMGILGASSALTA